MMSKVISNFVKSNTIIPLKMNQKFIRHQRHQLGLFSTAVNSKVIPDKSITGNVTHTVYLEKDLSKIANSRLRLTGGLKDLPMAHPAGEMYVHAWKATKAAKIDKEIIKNQRAQAKKIGAIKIDLMLNSITKPLGKTIKRYKTQLRILHPFEATLADLTVSARRRAGKKALSEVLQSVQDVRKEVLAVGKLYTASIKNATTKVEAITLTEECFDSIKAVMESTGKDALHELIEVQKSLRKLPIVKLNIPTCVLVGAPNVGKSSIVRAISSGTPEVNNYPFTTRGMTIGHITYPDFFGMKCQIMDTPGLLARPDEKRNEMEQLTMGSMRHLPTAVIYVMDLTGECGEQSSIEKQLQIREEIRKRFPQRPWLDIISKADRPKLDSPFLEMLPEGALHVSIVDGTGIPVLEKRVKEMYIEIQEFLKSLE